MDYKYIPCVFIFIPLIYVVCFAFLPNTPQFYLHKDRLQVRTSKLIIFLRLFALIDLANDLQQNNNFSPFQKAQDALKYYKNYEGKTELEVNLFNIEFERLKSIVKEQQADEKIHITDFSEYFMFDN